MRFLVIALVVVTTSAHAQTVALMTPYLSEPGVRLYVDAFVARAADLGFDLDVIDTKGDLQALEARMIARAAEPVDAIVINAAPTLVERGLLAAADAGVPVVGLDADRHPLIAVNVSSNGYAMAAQSAVFLADHLGGEGAVVLFVYDAFPPVQARGVVAAAIFENHPGIDIVARLNPDVSVDGFADSRRLMREVLDAHPEPGAIAGVWAAWDEPALAALAAIEDAGRAHEGIVVTGIDATPQAKAALAAANGLAATVAQDFEGMGRVAAEQTHAVLAGREPASPTIYLPAQLITHADTDP